jgi:serine/threonine-protein kinase RsbT
VRTLRFGIAHPVDLYGPRQAIREMASQLQFARGDCHELAIVVSELVSNIIKYGVRGSLRIEPTTSDEHGPGILIVASDEGPPFHDLELALRDGFSDRGPIDPATLLKRGGLGTGMGAIVRMSDSFQVQVGSAPDDGKEIRVVRYRSRPRRKRS